MIQIRNMRAVKRSKKHLKDRKEVKDKVTETNKFTLK